MILVLLLMCTAYALPGGQPTPAHAAESTLAHNTPQARKQKVEFHQAKVGMSMLSTKQAKDLWIIVGRFAQIEVILEHCQARSRIERRVFRAAAPCVQPASLKKVRRHFRGKMAYYRKRLVSLDCQAKEVKALLRAGRKAVDQVVNHVRNQCNSCFFC